MIKIKKSDIRAYTDVDGDNLFCQPCGREQEQPLYLFQVVTEKMLEKMKGDDCELFCDNCGEQVE